MTPAFNRHAIIGAIAADRAKSISQDPAGEAVIFVAHGPVPEDDNRKWLEDMAVIAEHVRNVGAVCGRRAHDGPRRCGPGDSRGRDERTAGRVEAQRALGGAS